MFPTVIWVPLSESYFMEIVSERARGSVGGALPSSLCCAERPGLQPLPPTIFYQNHLPCTVRVYSLFVSTSFIQNSDCGNVYN